MIIKNLTEFKTHDEYVDFTGTTAFVKPNVSYCDDKDEVHYMVDVTGVTLSPSHVEIFRGDTFKLSGSVLPTNATFQGLTWESSDPDIISVDENGVVTATEKGSATITVTTKDGGFSKTCSVLSKVGVTAVTLDKAEITMNKIGATEQVTATVLPADATNKNVTWTSSDDSIATVDNTGLVEAVSYGSATTTVTTEDGGYTANCAVNVEEQYYGEELTLIARGNGGFKVTSATTTFQYSKNNGNWTNATSATTISVSSGDRVAFKGTLRPPNSRGSATFSSSTPFDVEGNVMSLVYGDDFSGKTEIPSDGGYGGATFRALFSGSPVVDASKMKLPATKLLNSCYANMFWKCSSLIAVPELPALNLRDSCYENMFNNCTALETVPKNYLPSTNLAANCYMAMFADNIKLKACPDLPAATVPTYGYNQMFRGCKAITEPPVLLAETIGTWSLASMFSGCTSLTESPVLLPTEFPTSSCTQMFKECTSIKKVTTFVETKASAATYLWLYLASTTGTFVTKASTTWDNNYNGIPTGWTRQNI